MQITNDQWSMSKWPNNISFCAMIATYKLVVALINPIHNESEYQECALLNYWLIVWKKLLEFWISLMYLWSIYFQWKMSVDVGGNCHQNVTNGSLPGDEQRPGNLLVGTRVMRHDNT